MDTIERFFYRFRPTDRLLDKSHELEQQEIFFAAPKDLNDPLDGFKDIIWKGDEILWSNLLRHYLLCLTQAVTVAYIAGQDHIFATDECFVLANQATLPTPEYGDLHSRICDLFFRHSDVEELPRFLSARRNPIRRDELSVYLRLLHLHALNCVLKVMEESRIAQARAKDDPLGNASVRRIPFKKLFDAIDNSEREHPEMADVAEGMSVATEATSMQQGLILEYNGSSLRCGSAWQFLISEFPRRHVRDLEYLLYSRWYTACFVEDHTQAAMWGNYGDSHKGVCLKFRARPNSRGIPSLSLNQIRGCGGGKNGPTPIHGNIQHEFNEVEYKTKFAEIDFFCSLGRLTRPMLRYWFYDPSGKASSSVQGILSESENWREQYWKQLASAITTKLKDWAHEKEFRLTYVTESADPASRKLNYMFEDLQGIIFGIETSTSDKLKIMRIVEGKCRKENRKNFEFHQAYYSRMKGKIETIRLSLLKFR